MKSPLEPDDKQLNSSDQIGGDKIQAGNLERTVSAIGEGASVIYHNVERALTKVEVIELAEEIENKRLAKALTNYVHRLENQAARAKEDPGYGNPYKALLEFDIQDAALFYGRSAAIREVLTHIERDQLTVLHAGSGVGKTSLLKAGILPHLLADGHLPLYLRPYQTEVSLALKQALMINKKETPILANLSLHDFLIRATSLIGGRQLVIIIDQFEELFTVQNEQDRNVFINQLSKCLDDDLLPVRWVIALRDEWFGQLGTFRPRIKNPYANEILLHPLSRTEAWRVITEPAGRRGVKYEPELVKRLLDDLGKDKITPPHLQLVCSMLFDILDGRTEVTQEIYDEAGKAKGILREHLNRVLSRDVPRDMRAPARRLLEALVTSEKRRILRTQEDLTAELLAWGYPASLVDGILNQLIDSRLLRVEEFMPDKDHSVVAYELAHDYLLEEIEIDPETKARKAAQELLTQKLPYFKQENLLLSPQELAIILPQRKWLKTSEEEAELLHESQAVATRQRRMRRAGIVILVFALAITAILQYVAAERYERVASTAATSEVFAERKAGTAVAAEALAESKANTAVAAEALAERESNRSLSRELAAKAVLAKNLGEAIQAYQFAAQAYETADTFESRSALYTALSLPLPERIFRLPANMVDIVFAANFNPQGDRIVTACSDNLARIWDLSTGKVLFKLEGHTGPIMFTAYSPDGNRIVTASQDGSIGIWNSQDGDIDRLIPAHEGQVFSAIFSSDGSRIVTAGQDKTAAIWDVRNGKELFRLEGHERLVRFADFSPDGKRIVTASQDNTARVWDSLTGREIFTLAGHTARVKHATFSPDGTRIVTASADRTARVWDALTGDTLLYLVPHNGDVNSANFSPNGKYIVTSGRDSLISLWDASNGTLIATFSGHTDGVNWASFSPDGKWIVTASNDSTVWLREALRISGSVALIGHAHDVVSVNFSPDESRFVSASGDRTAWVWDARSGELLVVLEGHEKGVDFATFSPDGKQIVTASSDETVRVWDAVDGNELFQIPINASSVNFSPDGNKLITAGEDHITRVWDSQTRKELLPALEGHVDEVNYAGFSPDGTLIATAGGALDGTVLIWDAKTHSLLKTFTIVSGDEVNSISFSPDGKRLAIAADPNIAQVWDLDQGKLVKKLEGHQSDVSSANYSPDGRLIVTTSDDHTLRLWDAMTGNPLAVLQGHTDEVNWAAFTLDSKSILSASNDRTVRRWFVDFDDLHKFVLNELIRLNINTTSD